jgi:hypothetical protein
MSTKEFRALEQKDIKIGDTVKTQFRGGERKGVVKRIAMTKEETAHPPKVIFDTEKDGKEGIYARFFACCCA